MRCRRSRREMTSSLTIAAILCSDWESTAVGAATTAATRRAGNRRDNMIKATLSGRRIRPPNSGVYTVWAKTLSI